MIHPDWDPVGIPISAISILAIPILAIVTPFRLSEEGWENFTIVIEYNCMHGWCFNDHDVLNGFQWLMTDMSKWQCCALVITWCAVGENVLVCKGGGQEKWSSGLREALPSNWSQWWCAKYYVQQACTPLRWWCDWIPILAIPILAIHLDQDHNFSNPSQPGNQF